MCFSVRISSIPIMYAVMLANYYFLRAHVYKRSLTSNVFNDCSLYCSEDYIWHLRYLTWWRLSYLKLFFVLFQMFSDLLYPEDKAFLFIFPDLLLSLTEKSPDFLGKIYENPLVIFLFIFLIFIKVDCK
jgi:hypothetical protein